MATFDTGEMHDPHRSTSPLLRLPAEIRHQIYDYVYPKHMLHVKRIMYHNRKNTGRYIAYWCVEAQHERHAHLHRACHTLEAPRKHTLALPLACKQLYNETMQRVYSRPEFHFYFEELVLLWAKQTPKIFHTALTCVTITSMSFDARNPETYQKTWEFLAALSNLQTLSVFVTSNNNADLWEDSLQEMAEPTTKVQQHTLTHFDLIFDITPTWFPDDCYLKINYNKLHWDTFIIDRAEYSVFDGLHSKCRLIGMNGYLLYRPIPQVLPTAQELTEWIECFSCNSAYGIDEPDGYDPDEIGEQAMAAQRIKDAPLTESAHANEEEFHKLRDELEDKYLYGPDCDDDPEHWDLAAIDQLADHMEMPNTYLETPHWYYPEKPSWVAEDEL